MVGDRLELDACDLELVCIVYLGFPMCQLRPATGCAGSYMKETGAPRTGIADSWKPEAQARGWGTPRIVLTPLLRQASSPLSAHLAAPQPLARAPGFHDLTITESIGYTLVAKEQSNQVSG